MGWGRPRPRDRGAERKGEDRRGEKKERGREWGKRRESREIQRTEGESLVTCFYTHYPFLAGGRVGVVSRFGQNFIFRSTIIV